MRFSLLACVSARRPRLVRPRSRLRLDRRRIADEGQRAVPGVRLGPPGIPLRRQVALLAASRPRTWRRKSPPTGPCSPTPSRSSPAATTRRGRARRATSSCACPSPGGSTAAPWKEVGPGELTTDLYCPRPLGRGRMVEARQGTARRGETRFRGQIREKIPHQQRQEGAGAHPLRLRLLLPLAR